MFSCPKCQKELQPQRGPQGVVWLCPYCHGHAAGLGILRKIFGPERVATIWADADTTRNTDGCACPVCRQAMARVSWVENEDEIVTLDLCRRCEFVWFDPAEFESLTPAPPKPPPIGTIDKSKLTDEQREKLAMVEVARLAREEQQADGPAEDWKSIPGLFGLPVEMDVLPCPRKPIATYLTAGLIAIVCLAEFLARFTTKENVIQQFGLIPAEWSRDGGLTFITSFFLHAGPYHLVTNLYFLVVFGRHVEEYLGSLRWILLLVAATLVGDAVDVFFTFDSTIPTIGASGGISGLLAFYALKFPHARLGIMMRYFYQYQWITISAWSAFGIWILLQLLGAYEQLKHVGSVASLAHLGGVMAGVAAYGLWKNLDAKPGLAKPTSNVPQATIQ